MIKQIRRVVLSASLLLVVPPASAGHPCRDHYPAGTSCAESTISIRYGREMDRFSGDVDSHMGYCRRNRTVALRRVSAGPDETVGTTTTSRRGRWMIEFNADRGRFYAVARYKDRSYGIDGVDICYRARSDTARIR